jgi:lysophospholipase L1-like esterase
MGIIATRGGVGYEVDPVTGGMVFSVGGVDVGMTKRQGLTVALFGDSFSVRNSTTGTLSRDLDWGYFSWTQALLGAPFQLVANAGVSGNRTDQMLARMSDATAYSPDWCFVQGGINDITYGTTAAQIVTNLKSICSQMAAQGINVVLLTVAPNTQVAGNSTKVQQINQALREWINGGGGKGIVFVDTYAAMVNPTATTGALATGMSDDSLHPSAKGAKAMGQAIANALQYLLPSRNFLPSSAGESYDIDNTSKQILANPLMAAGGGAPTGTGASGSLPTGWSGSTGGSGASSAVFSTPARADGFGNDAQVVVSGAAASSSVNIRQTGLVGRLAIGDTVYACGEITVSGASDVRQINIGGNVTIDSVTTSFNALEASGSTNYDQTAVTLRFRTNDITLTGASISSVQFIASVTFGTSGTGAATIKFGRCGLYKK